uniref:Uncharacterized protein n=1 Tax=Nelumbo nucifera TaxID=4432 RepID=A0A822Y4C2_NELNU|nr:TPA_asm: hypothetical protein HUJ06_027544 [Nelumbo nucifera]
MHREFARYNDTCSALHMHTTPSMEHMKVDRGFKSVQTDKIPIRPRTIYKCKNLERHLHIRLHEINSTCIFPVAFYWMCRCQVKGEDSNVFKLKKQPKFNSYYISSNEVLQLFLSTKE